MSNNAFTRSGYALKSWKDNASNTTYTNGHTVKNLTDADNGIITLYAQWTANTYKISFDLNGGELGKGQTNPTSYDIESEKFSPNDPTKKGYDFEGGIVSPDNPKSYTIESSEIKLTRPTKQGYDFTGWSFDAEISLDVAIVKGSTGNREYVATWTAIEYTISYTLNNGSVSGNPDKYTIESESITLNNPSRNGYQFDGWTDTDLSGKTQSVIIASGSTGDRSYTANFTPITYTISYELNGGTNNADNPSSYTIETATITLKAPTRYGYNFVGWTFNDEAISEIAQ